MAPRSKVGRRLARDRFTRRGKVRYVCGPDVQSKQPHKPRSDQEPEVIGMIYAWKQSRQTLFGLLSEVIRGDMRVVHMREQGGRGGYTRLGQRRNVEATFASKLCRIFCRLGARSADEKGLEDEVVYFDPSRTRRGRIRKLESGNVEQN